MEKENFAIAYPRLEVTPVQLIVRKDKQVILTWQEDNTKLKEAGGFEDIINVIIKNKIETKNVELIIRNMED